MRNAGIAEVDLSSASSIPNRLHSPSPRNDRKRRSLERSLEQHASRAAVKFLSVRIGPSVVSVAPAMVRFTFSREMQQWS